MGILILNAGGDMSTMETGNIGGEIGWDEDWNRARLWTSRD